MDRRKFFRNGSLFTLGTALLNPFESTANVPELKHLHSNKKAKNIIFLVSDGMSTGTLNMADMLLDRKMGKGSNWLQLYKSQRVTRALMDTASASSIVTDSSAASSSWGGGHRVKNGSLNIGPNGERHMPIWQKFKKAGKMAGCVTTVPITHATPAGFCVNNDSRNAQQEIAEDYLKLGFDIMMGGGNKYFSAEMRKDKKDVYADYKAKGWQVVRSRSEMMAATNKAPVLGVFADDALPYSIDRENDKPLQDTTPTLAEMAQKAIDHMKGHNKGFVLQIEGGKVDWGAHANDVAALLYDQIAFDEAVKVAIDFAEKDQETLVIITTDHGNANPGVIYGKNANDNFDNIQRFTHTNEWILNTITPETTVAQVKEIINAANTMTLSDEDAKTILGFYTAVERDEDGLYACPTHGIAVFKGMVNDIGKLVHLDVVYQVKRPVVRHHKHEL